MKVLLDNKEITINPEESLPMLIQGEPKQGSSFYTIALAALWFQSGYDIICLSGFPYAKEAFVEIIGEDSPSAKFFTAEEISEFKKELAVVHQKRIVILKNFELFSKEVFGLVLDIPKLVVSGNVNDAKLAAKVMEKDFATKILFSSIPRHSVPELGKYEAYFLSKNAQGITKLQL